MSATVAQIVDAIDLGCLIDAEFEYRKQAEILLMYAEGLAFDFERQIIQRLIDNSKAREANYESRIYK